MSWKLTKSTAIPFFLCFFVADLSSFFVELKETTLGSSSPAVTTKQSSGTITSPSQSGSSAEKSSSSSISSTSNTNPTSDSTLKPGRLTVQIYEAKGLTLPPGINRPTERPPSSSSASSRGHDRAKPSRSHLALPYIVLEFDKNEVLLETNYGELSAPVWGRVQDLYPPLEPYSFFTSFISADSVFHLVTSHDHLNFPHTYISEPFHNRAHLHRMISIWEGSKSIQCLMKR